MRTKGRKKLAARCLQRIHDQEAWIKSQGGDRDGYIVRYGVPGTEACIGDGGAAVYAADVAELQRLQIMYDEVMGTEPDLGSAVETESVR